MAGQQETAYRPDTPQQSQFDPSPTIQTAPFQPTTARVDASGQTQAFQAMSNAFGNFFGSVNQTAAQVNQTVETARVNQIDQENKALAQQGQIDAQSGKGPQTDYTSRQAYSNAYFGAVADQHTTQLTSDLKAHLDSLPNDGSVDLHQEAQQFYKDNIGTGTGNREFDSRLLLGYTQAADSLIAQKQEQVAQTVESNTTQTILNDGITQMNSPDGMSSAKFAVLNDRILAVTKGDQVQADKIVGSMLSDPRNKTQAVSVLNALQDSGWADRNPQAYNQIAQKQVQSIQKVKSVEALSQVNKWQMDMRMLAANPNANLSDVAGMLYRASDIDSNYGVGMQRFSEAFTVMGELAKRKASANLFEIAVNGRTGTHDGPSVAAQFGKSPEDVEKGIDPFLLQMVTGTPGYPGMAASAQANGGVVDPLASDIARDEYVAWALSPNVLQATGGSFGKRIADSMTSALLGSDPNRGARAFQAMKQVEARVGSNALTKYFGGNQEALGMYRALDSLKLENRNAQDIFTELRDNRLDRGMLEKAGETGQFNFDSLYGKQFKPGEIDQKIQAAAAKTLLGDTGRDGVFFNPNVGIGSDDMAEYKAILAHQSLLLSRSGQLDFNQAVSNSATIFAQTRYATIGRDGAVRVIPDPYNGAGRTLGDPLNKNPNSPVSTAKGYPPIYAGAPMNNALGQTEDPMAHARDDLDSLHKALPGIATESSQLWFANPDKSGLQRVVDITGRPLEVTPGMNIATRNQDGVDLIDKISPFIEGSQEALIPDGPVKGSLQQSKVPSDPT